MPKSVIENTTLQESAWPLPASSIYTPFRASVKGPNGEVRFQTSNVEFAISEMERLMEPLDKQQRRKVARELRSQLELPAKVEDLMRRFDALPEDARSGKNALKLERAQSSRAHHIAESARSGGMVLLSIDDRKIARAQSNDAEVDLGQIFVVDHDWAAVFEGAEDYGGPTDFRLPFKVCCFEFRMSGRHIAVIAHQNDTDQIEASALVELRVGKNLWLLAGGAQTASGTMPKIDGLWQPILAVAQRQIKAICVALEAEVATAEVVRAPYRLNARREREGKLPLFDHHIVRLSRRSRAAPLPAADGEREPGRRRRLHFRRGHWRHYADHKTWIKWQLVGNPELGWIEKEYRL